MEAFDLHVFRVIEGGGNACAVKLPDAATLVVDWGTRDEAALDRLFERVVADQPIRCVVATHAHDDHTRGLVKLFERAAARRTAVERFVYPVTADHRARHPMTQACLKANELGIPHHDLDVSTLPDARPHILARNGSFAVQVLAPPDHRTGRSQYQAYGRRQVPGNETSMVLLLRFLGSSTNGQGRILLPGDAEPATLDFAKQQAGGALHLSLDNQAFVVPHHGSQRNLPDWILPHLHGALLLSTPTDSRHHPHGSVLARLSSHARSRGACEVFCTAYAQACRTEFGARAGPHYAHLVAPGDCFGHVTIRVPALGNAAKIGESAPGDRRRPFGFCSPTADDHQ